MALRVRIPLIFDVCDQPDVVSKPLANKAIIIIFSLAIAILLNGILVTDMQQANADKNDGDGNNSCDKNHHPGSSQCPHNDGTPFLLPFP